MKLKALKEIKVPALVVVGDRTPERLRMRRARSTRTCQARS